jgi:hypothetical protein
VRSLACERCSGMATTHEGGRRTGSVAQSIPSMVELAESLRVSVPIRRPAERLLKTLEWPMAVLALLVVPVLILEGIRLVGSCASRSMEICSRLRRSATLMRSAIWPHVCQRLRPVSWGRLNLLQSNDSKRALRYGSASS